MDDSREVSLVERTVDRAREQRVAVRDESAEKENIGRSQVSVTSVHRKQERLGARNSSPSSPPNQTLKQPWFSALPSVDSVAREDRLHEEIVAFSSYLMPSVQEDVARGQVVRIIERLLQKKYKDSRVVLFGSVPQGLCLPDADLDIAMSVQNVKSKSKAHKEGILRSLPPVLKRARVTNYVTVIPRARVPIMKFRTTLQFGSYKIDLGVNNTETVPAIEMIRGYISSMPALRPLVLILKLYLSQKGLNDASLAGLSSYTLTCMVISFLQLNPTARPQAFIDNPTESKSLGILLIDFLQYYSTSFPYNTHYISVREGKILPKENSWVRQMSMRRGCLTVQCLLDPTNDIGRSAGRIKEIKAAFAKAYTALKAPPPSEGQCDNILDAIVCISADMLEHRIHVQNLVDSGKLGNLFRSMTGGPQRSVSPADRKQVGPSHLQEHQYQYIRKRSPPLEQKSADGPSPSSHRNKRERK